MQSFKTTKSSQTMQWISIGWPFRKKKKTPTTLTLYSLCNCFYNKNGDLNFSASMFDHPRFQCSGQVIVIYLRKGESLAVLDWKKGKKPIEPNLTLPLRLINVTHNVCGEIVQSHVSVNSLWIWFCKDKSYAVCGDSARALEFMLVCLISYKSSDWSSFPASLCIAHTYMCMSYGPIHCVRLSNS